MSEGSSNSGPGEGGSTASESPESMGYGSHYDRTARIESMASHGLTYGDRTRKEAEFILREVGVGDIAEGDQIRVLDLACGVGAHSREMDKILRAEYDLEPKIEARDLSRAQIEKAKDLQTVADQIAQVRSRIHFDEGNFLNIQRYVEEGAQFNLITILGSSFMYLKNKAEHEQALNDMFGLLAPGGRIVIQFREGMGNRGKSGEEVQKKWCEDLGVVVGERAIEEDREEQRKLGKFAPKDAKSIYGMGDLKKGDGFYFYDVPPEEHPAFEGLEPQYDPSGNLTGFAKSGSAEILYTAVRNGQGKISHFIDGDGLKLSGFGRAYVDENGQESDLGPTYVIDYMSRKGSEVLMDMMNKVGFYGIRREEEPLSPDGSITQYAVIAQKPVR